MCRTPRSFNGRATDKSRREKGQRRTHGCSRLVSLCGETMGTLVADTLYRGRAVSLSIRQRVITVGVFITSLSRRYGVHCTANADLENACEHGQHRSLNRTRGSQSSRDERVQSAGTKRQTKRRWSSNGRNHVQAIPSIKHRYASVPAAWTRWLGGVDSR
jgi:hypothetical protein